MSLLGWGRNRNKAVAPAADVAVLEPRQQAGGSLARRRVVGVACGLDFTVAVDEDGDVLAWGLGREGQTGAGRPVGLVGEPTRVGRGGLGTRRVVSVVAGEASAAAITAEGEVFMWGFLHAALAGEEDGPSLALTGLARGAQWMSESLKERLRRSTIQYLTAGGVDLGNGNGDGTGGPAELDQATIDAEAGIIAVRTRRKAVYTPMKSRFSRPVAEVALGTGHSLIRTRDDSTLWAAGSNDRGQLGSGTRINTHVFEPVKGALMGVPVATMCAGNSHSIAVLPDGRAFSFGSNVLGQLGVGSEFADQLLPLQMRCSEHVVVAAAAGSFHSVVLTRDGAVMSFGHAEYGQHGDRVDESAGDFRHLSRHFFVPQKVFPFVGSDTDAHAPRIVSVRCGEQFNMALDHAGRVWTWGSGQGGTLGHAPGRYRGSHPQVVDGLAPYTVLQIAAGHKHAFVLTEPLGAPYAATFNGMRGMASSSASPPTADVVEIQTPPGGGGNTEPSRAHVHLGLLRARCPALAKTVSPPPQMVVALPRHIEPRVLGALVEYLYTDRTMSCPPHRLLDLGRLATEWGLPRLAALCALQHAQRMSEVGLVGAGSGATSAAPPPPSTFARDMLQEWERLQSWPWRDESPETLKREGVVVFSVSVSASASASASGDDVDPLAVRAPPPGHTAFSWAPPASTTVAVPGHTRFSLGLAATVGQPQQGQEKTVLAHIAVLQRYKFFRVMLGSDFAEGTAALAGKPVHVDADAESFETMMRWVYSGDAGVLRNENVFGALLLAIRFGVDDLQRACERYASTRVTTDNAREMFEFARSQGLARLGRQSLAALRAASLVEPGDDQAEAEWEEDVRVEDDDAAAL